MPSESVAWVSMTSMPSINVAVAENEPSAPIGVAWPATVMVSAPFPPAA